MPQTNYYEVLGVPQTATLEQILDSIKEADLCEEDLLMIALSDEEIALAILDDKELANKLSESTVNLGEKYLSCALKIIQEKRLSDRYSGLLFPYLFNMACRHEKSCRAFFNNNHLKSRVSGKLLFEFKDQDNILAKIRQDNPEIQKRFQAYEIIQHGCSGDNLEIKLVESHLTQEERYLLGLNNLEVAKLLVNSIAFCVETFKTPDKLLHLYIKHRSLLGSENFGIDNISFFEGVSQQRIVELAKTSKKNCLAVINQQAGREKFNGKIWNDVLTYFPEDPEIFKAINKYPDALQKLKAYQYLTQTPEPNIEEYIASLKATLSTADLYPSSDTYELIIDKKLSIEQLLVIIKDAELVAILSYAVGELACIDQKIADEILRQPELCKLFAFPHDIWLKLAKTTEQNCLAIFKNPLFKSTLTGKMMFQLVESYPNSSKIAEAICIDPSLDRKFKQAILLRNVTQKTHQIAQNIGSIPAADDGAIDFSIAMEYLKENNLLLARQHLMIDIERWPGDAEEKLGVFLASHPNSYFDAEHTLAVVEEYWKYLYEKNTVGIEHETSDLARINELTIIRQHCLDKTLPYFINALSKAVLEDNKELMFTIAARIHEMLAALTPRHYFYPHATYKKICDCKPLLSKDCETNALLLGKIKVLYEEYSSFLIIIFQEREKFIKSPYLLNILSQPDFCLGLITTYGQLKSLLYKEKSNLALIHLALCIFNKDFTLNEIKSMPNYLRKILVNLLSDTCTESLDFFHAIRKNRYLRLDFDLDSMQIKFSQWAKLQERLTVLQEKIAVEIQAAHQKRKGHWQDIDWEFEGDNENDIEEESYENEFHEKVKNLIKSGSEKDEISSHIISTLFYVQNETGDPEASFQISIKKTLCHAMSHQNSFLLKILLENIQIQLFLRTANLTKTELSQLLCVVIQIGELELVKTVVGLGAPVNPIDANFYPLRSVLDKAPIIQYLIEQGAKIREDLIENEWQYGRVTIDCRKTLLYYLADRNKSLTGVFKYSFAPILRAKLFTAGFTTENLLIMLNSFLMTGLLDKKILSSIEKGFEMEKDQKTIFDTIKKLVNLLDTIYISRTAIEKFLETQKSNPYKDIFISYTIHRLFLNLSKSKLFFSHLLIQDVTDPIFKDLLSNKLFFSALIEEKISPQIFKIIRDVIYNRSRDSQDLKLSETYTLVEKAISSISKKNPALNGYLWQHFWDKYTRYLFTAEKFEQLLSLWHEGIKDNLLSVDTMFNYIDYYQSNISITLLVYALLNYRVSLINQKQEIFNSESNLINKVLTTYKPTLKEIVAVQRNIGIEIDINNVSEIQKLRTLLLKHEWKTNKTSNELAINIYLNGNRTEAHSYLVNDNTNWLDVFIKQNDYKLWQGYLEQTQPAELWEDFQSCGKTPTDRKNHFQTLIRQSPHLPADKCYNQVFQNTFPFEIINLFTDNIEEKDTLSLNTARQDLIHLLHLLGSLKETSKHDINQKLRTYLTKVSQYDKKENTKKSNTFFASEPSDYYGSLRKCFLTLEPIEELPGLARFLIETAANSQYASPGARQFSIQYNLTYPTQVKLGLSEDKVEKIEEKTFEL